MLLNSDSRVPRFREITEADVAPAAARPRAKRAARLPAFVGLERPADPALDGLKVAVIGAGSVGRLIALHLARLQIATLWIIDPARYKSESLLTQPITPGEIKQPKASSTGILCKAISPASRVFVFDGPVQALSGAAIDEAGLVAMATDNLRAEVEVGQRCLHLSAEAMPLVHASVYGPTMTAQVRTFGNRNAAGPCPACGYSEAEWADLNLETIHSCAANGGSPGETTTAPTMSVSSLCSMAADLAVTQILRHALGFGEPVEDTLVEYSGYTHRTTVSRLKRNAHCRCEHLAWRPINVAGPLDGLALRQIAAEAGLADARDVSFAPEDLIYVEAVMCCGRRRPVQRFAAADGPMTQCAECTTELRPQGYFSHRPVPAAVARPVLDRPLARIGAAGVESIVVRGQGRAVLVRFSAATADVASGGREPPEMRRVGRLPENGGLTPPARRETSKD